ncbi:MAG: peptidylprolyl isomerase, partial [Azoarcus sp.]|nr:peptidylprolyl isomerase [Azoarcus sp.]
FSDDAVKRHHNTQAIELGGNTLISARVTDFEAARRPPLDEVRPAIEKQLRTEEAGRLAAERGAAALAALQKGETVEGEWSASRKLQRGAPALPGNAMQAVFSATSVKLPAYAGVAQFGEGYSIYRIESINRPKLAADDPRIAAVVSQYSRVLAERDFAGLVNELRQRYKVAISLPPVRTQ